MSKLFNLLTFKGELSRAHYALTLLTIVGIALVSSILAEVSTDHFYQSSFDSVSSIMQLPYLLMLLYIHVVALVARLRNSGLTNKFGLLAVVVVLLMSTKFAFIIQVLALGLPKQFFKGSILQKL